MACAAALAVQNVIKRDDLLANVQAQGEHLARRLSERFGNHPYVGDIRGRGLFQALEFVTDRGTKAPFDPKLKLHARVKSEAMARGLLVYPIGGTIDGARGDHALIAPPFIVERDRSTPSSSGWAMRSMPRSVRARSSRLLDLKRGEATLVLCRFCMHNHDRRDWSHGGVNMTSKLLLKSALVAVGAMVAFTGAPS